MLIGSVAKLTKNNRMIVFVMVCVEEILFFMDNKTPCFSFS